MTTGITLDLDTATLRFDSDGAVQVQQLGLPQTVLRSSALRGALPSMDKISTALKANPEAAGQLVADYIDGRMDAAASGVVRLGLVDSSVATRSLVPGESAETSLVVLIVIIVIVIIILAFPKTVHAPTKQPPKN